MKSVIFNKIRRFKNIKVDPTIINDEQLNYLVTYALDVINKNIEGDFVEFGCYVGESSKFLKKCLVETKVDKELYVYDSFEGLPPLSKWEESTGWKPGTLNTTEDVLVKNFKDNGLRPPIISKGWFKDIPDYKIPEKISFAFLDGDFYDSIFDSLTKIYDKVSDGGYILFHDYERNDLPGVKAAIEDFFLKRGVEFNIVKLCDQLAAIKKNGSVEKLMVPTNELTVVTGLWNIGRPGRDFNQYIDNFKKFLDIPQNLFIYIPKEYEHLVWEKRSEHNTFVKIYELDDVKRLYSPHWDRTQSIRNDLNWLNKTGENGWLKNSPQAVCEWYNPIVQSKMFLLNDVTIWNPFDTKHFIWLDAGITNTVYEKYFTDNKCLDKILPHLDSFLFLSYPYEADKEIHGFDFDKINQYSGQTVKYVCRGGLFGGTKDHINQANALYYSLLDKTLSEGCMGTEESIFTIMAHVEPEKYRRYSLDSNGLIVKFAQALIDNKVELEPIPEIVNTYTPRKYVDPDKLKLSIYMLTFNFPHQVEHTIKTWLKHPKWITNTRNILIDNSTNEEARIANAELCKKYNFEHIINNKNTGINGGRYKAAKHFQESDSDYYIFLEDDMGIHEPNHEVCRNGFRTYVPNLYDKVLKIIDGDADIDFLKFSYTEVYMDNNIQVSWYNVPQSVRTQIWPNYNKLPVTGLDPNCPRTKFDTIEVVDGLSYIKGEIYYANWPMIVGKKGNKKMFLDTVWEYPYEQTWMSHMFQETRKGNLKPAILLASPVNHNRIAHYKPEERKENAG